MRTQSTTRFALTSAACVGIALTMAACSSSKTATASSPHSSSSSQPASSAGGSTGASVAAAAIADYIGKPTSFPVIDPLRALPKGKKFIYVNCGTPYCALIYTLMQPAAATMGVNLTQVTSGETAASIASAFDAVVADKPDAVIVAGVNIDLWKNQLKELQNAKIPVVTGGVTGVAQYGIKSSQAAEPWGDLSGKLMADYVTAKLGRTSNVVVYTNPELSFTGIIADAFDKELASVCPDCSVRTVPIPIAQIGNVAPNTVVRDLEKNPKTDVAVFPNNTSDDGLPAALAASGRKIKIVGDASAPEELQYIKDGTQTVGLGLDVAVQSWVFVDQAAREVTGQSLTGPEAAGIPVMQFLSQTDITFDPSRGWTGYPDFVARFKTLWHVS